MGLDDGYWIRSSTCAALTMYRDKSGVVHKNLIAACYEETGGLYTDAAKYELAERNYGQAMTVYVNLGMRNEAASVDEKHKLLSNK